VAADLSGRRASRSRAAKAGSARGGDACGTVGREYGKVCEVGLEGVGGGTAGCSMDACGCSSFEACGCSSAEVSYVGGSPSPSEERSEGEPASSSHESATSSCLGLSFEAGIWRSGTLSGGTRRGVSGCHSVYSFSWLETDLCLEPLSCLMESVRLVKVLACFKKNGNTACINEVVARVLSHDNSSLARLKVVMSVPNMQICGSRQKLPRCMMQGSYHKDVRRE